MPKGTDVATAEQSTRARDALDRRLGALGPSSRYQVPPRGWVRAIRDALGMTTADLGARMGVTGQSASELEGSERGGRARLDTLARAARAMDCTFVYAFIPNGSLQQTVQNQAVAGAQEHASRARHSMGLEDQLPEDSADALVQELAAELIRTGRVWRSA